jgi:predicted ATPase
MARILGIRIRRYKALYDIRLGRIQPSHATDELPPIACLIGPNGCGKSTLLDAFGFLADCLRENVEAACDKPHRGGFKRLRTQGAEGPIEFEILYRQGDNTRPIYYQLAIDEENGTPHVSMEVLKQSRGAATHGQLYTFLELKGGRGNAWSGATSVEGQEEAKRIPVRLADPRVLAINTLGNLKEHPRINAFAEYIGGWYLSYFVPDLARSLPAAGAQKHLNRTGENLGNYVEYMQRSHRDKLKAVLDRIAKRIPGVTSIKATVSADNRVLIAFDEAGYKDPFYQPSMSDGTLKMFAYLLMMEDPEPQPFIGIEEPENGLYHKLVERLADELKAHAADRNVNVVVTTHSTYFVDALQPEQVWMMQKKKNGHTAVKRAADMQMVKAMAKEGIPLGSLWYSRHFEERVRL